MSGLRALCCSKGDRADTQDTQATRPAQPRLAKTTQDVPPTIKQVPSTVVVPEKEEGHEKQQEQDKEEQDHEQEEGKEKEKLETPASRDLWKEAFDSLDPVGQSYLAGSDVPANVAIDRVIQDTTAKYKEWKTGGLKIRRKSGDDINIRDSAERIIGAAQKANGAISTIVSFDPTGHASSAWTVISFGMSIVQNRLDRRDAIFAASEFLAETLAYYALFEKAYRNQGVGTDRHIDEAILQVYSAILRYTAEVTKARDENEAKRTLNSVFALNDTPLNALKETISEKNKVAEKWKTLAQSLGDRQNAARHLQKTDDLLESMRRMMSKALSEEQQKIMDWVSKTPYSKRQRELQNKRTGDTGEWLLELPQYNEWRSTPGNLLWLPGISGCGKSVLCSTAVGDIEEDCRLNPSKFIAYWYFQLGVDETQTVDSMIRSLIRQLSRAPLKESVTNLWDTNGFNNSLPDSKSLLNVLEDVISNTPGEVYLLFDALDECPDNVKIKERRVLLSLLTGLLERHKNKIHILATSRPERDIEKRLGKFPKINLEVFLADDVRKFVTTSVTEGDLSESNPEVQKAIIDTLLSLRERRFRWAELQIMELEGCNNDKEVYHALKTVPHSLEDTYRKILDRIQKKDVDIARGIFSLLCLSPVTLDLETVAAMVDITVSAVVRICTTSLVSVFEGKIQFAHFSVQEFIVLSGELEVVSHHPCQFTILSGQFELAERTVDCLLGQTEELDQFQALERPAFLYSARYWSTHLAACGDISQTHPEIQSKVNRIFTTPTVYFNWIRAADSDSSWDNPWSKLLKECPAPLHKATSLALLRTVECLVTEGADPAGYSSSNMFRASPFFLAARLGHLDILQLFLDKTPFPQKELRYLLANFECANADKPKLEKVLRTLWDQGLLCGQSPDLTNTLSEKVLADVARRCDSGIAMLDIFLDWRPEIRVPVTEEFITLAICEKNVPRECLHLLFKRCDIHMPYISKSSMSNRVSFTGSLPGVAYVAEEWPDKLEIFDLLLARFAEYEPPTVFESLLKHRKEDTPVTQDVLEKAANNSRYPNMLLSLWSHRQPDTKVTDSMVKHATLRTIHSEELLRFTLEGFRLHSTLAEETVSSCLYFCTDGVATLKMLIEYTPSSLWTSEELVERICAHAHAVGMLDLLAQIDGFCVPITEDILRYAAGNVNGPFVVRSLAQMQKNPFEVTENVILAAVENRDSGAEVIRSLMQDASPDIWTDAVFEGACENKEVMVLLLDQNRKDLPIEKMLEALKESSNVFESKDTLQVLLERNILQVDEHLIETLASSSTLLDCMLLFNPDVHITHKALLSATANCRSMRLIMGARGNSLPVTDDVLVAAIEAYSDKEMFQLVLDRQGSLPITHKIIEKGLEYRMIVGWLLELVPESDLEKLWQPTWCDTQLAVEDRVQNLLAILFIQRSKMTDGMLEMFPYDPEDGENYGFDELVEMLCTDDDDDIPALSGTERAAEIILERCNNEMIEMFVHCDRYSCSITDNLIQAAGRNRIADQEKLMAFLEQERS